MKIKGHYGSVTCDIAPLEDGQFFLTITNDLPWRTGFIGDDRQNISFIDPAQGPFISVGSNLESHHRNLPDKLITRITKRDSGFVLHTN